MWKRVRGVLRPIAGRETRVWRALRSPRLRYALFRNPIDCVIYGLLISQARVFFVQVGSNDGRTNDPLWTFRLWRNWQGILVEPVGYVFERLRRNYAPWRDRFVLENTAVACESGPQRFHYFAQADDLADGYDMLGSFNLDLLRRHGRFVSGAKIVTATIQCMTFHELCDRHEVSEIDVVHVDAEGADREILEQVDFERYRPSIVVFEHALTPEAELRRLDRHLLDAGYELTRVGIDTLAVRRRSIASMPALRAAWRTVTGS